ncbi:MAG: hypothetical protein WCI77_01715 [Candidatus Omnitrophota bacterium]
MNGYFYILILITGILSVITDIREKKIKNIHLGIISLLAILLYLIGIFTGTLRLSLALVANPLIGLGIGFILYGARLWQAGDAKLFFTYSLLLPVNIYKPILPFSCFSLFINSFLLSFIVLLPLSLHSIIANKNKIIKQVVSVYTFFYFINLFLIILGISWVVQPLVKLFPLKDNVFLNFIVLGIAYSLAYRFINTLKRNKIVIGIVFVAGLLLHYLFVPQFFSAPIILQYLSNTLIYTAIFYILRIVISIKEEHPMRIPFSPFMFIGAYLSNTNILWWILKIIGGY